MLMMKILGNNSFTSYDMENPYDNMIYIDKRD